MTHIRCTPVLQFSSGYHPAQHIKATLKEFAPTWSGSFCLMDLNEHYIAVYRPEQ